LTVIQSFEHLNLTAMGLNYYVVLRGGGGSRDPALHFVYTGLSTFHTYGVKKASSRQ